MAFKFNAILQFNAGNAKKALAEAGANFRNLEKSIKKTSASMSNISQGAGAAGAAMLPFTVGLGLTIKAASDFETSMAKVQAIMLASKEEMVPMQNVIRELGRTTAFSAVEVAGGAELLGQAGFNMQQIMVSLPAVVDAAAASGETMADVANVMASNIGAFGLKAEDARMVADTLALTTVATNTTFKELAEGMTYAMTSASRAGISFQETAASIGIMSNAGLKGSSAGTAFENMLRQLAEPSKAAIKLFGGKKGLSDAIMQVGVDGKTHLRPMEVIMANMATVIAKAKDPMEALQFSNEIFGVRGAKVLSTFQGQMLQTTAITNQNRDSILKGADAAKKMGENWDKEIAKGVLPTLVALRLQMLGAEGSSAKMAAIKLATFNGQLKMVKAAINDIAIGLGTQLLPDLTRMATTGVDALRAIGLGFEVAFSGKAATVEQLDKINERFRPLVESATEFAKGFIEGFKEFKDEAMSAIESVRGILQPFLGDISGNNKEMGRLIAKFVLWGAIAGPVLVAVAGAFAIMAPILMSIVSMFSLIGGAFGIMKSVIMIGVVGINWVLAGLGSTLTVGSMLWSAMAFAGTTALAILTSPITAVIAIIGFFVAGIAGIVRGWDTVKFAFQEDGWMAAVWVAFGAFGQGIWDAISWPFVKLKDMFLSMVGWIAKTTARLGFSILSGAANWLLGGGNDVSANNRLPNPPSIKTAPGPIIDQGVNPQTEAFRLQEQQLKQKSIVQPPSADANAEALASRMPAPGGGGGGGKTDVNVQLQGEFKLKGNDLNLVVTRSQVSQAERNGKTIAPERKRQLMTNGAPLGAGG